MIEYMAFRPIVMTFMQDFVLANCEPYYRSIHAYSGLTSKQVRILPRFNVRSFIVVHAICMCMRVCETLAAFLSTASSISFHYNVYC
jgi:hypothetical protein